jgi:methionine-rich copper-binding protein CopC
MQRLTLALGAIALMGFAPAGWMHTHLVKAEPAVDGTINTTPKELRLWFNEPPEVALSAASVMKEDHSPVAVVKMKATDDSLSVAGTVPVALEPGRYMVMWRTGSKDGHAVRGMYYFTFDPAAEPKP